MVTRAYLYYCPICQKPVDLAGITDRADFTEPFFGEPGSRLLHCRLGAHMHFSIETENGRSSRYAYVKPYVRLGVSNGQITTEPVSMPALSRERP